MEPHDLQVEPGKVPGQSHLRTGEDLGLQVRIGPEAAQGVGVQLPERGEARATADACVKEQSAARRERREAEAGTPVPQAAQRGLVRRLGGVRSVDGQAHVEPRGAQALPPGQIVEPPFRLGSQAPQALAEFPLALAGHPFRV